MVLTIYHLLNAYYVPGIVLSSLLHSSLDLNNSIRWVYDLSHTLRNQDQDLHNLLSFIQLVVPKMHYVRLLEELKRKF